VTVRLRPSLSSRARSSVRQSPLSDAANRPGCYKSCYTISQLTRYEFREWFVRNGYFRGPEGVNSRHPGAELAKAVDPSYSVTPSSV
jgi:hypothetical protein